MLIPLYGARMGGAKMVTFRTFIEDIADGNKFMPISQML